MGSNHRRARLQRAALPLSYLCETEMLERPGRIELLVDSPATSHSAIELRPRAVAERLVGRDGFEQPQNERRFYRALGSPMPSLPELAEK
jgi:hypothetical protein